MIWIIVAIAVVVLMIVAGVVAWALAAAAALGDEIDRIQREARNGIEILSHDRPPAQYRPVSRRHWEEP